MQRKVQLTLNRLFRRITSPRIKPLAEDIAIHMKCSHLASQGLRLRDSTEIAATISAIAYGKYCVVKVIVQTMVNNLGFESPTNLSFLPFYGSKGTEEAISSLIMSVAEFVTRPSVVWPVTGSWSIAIFSFLPVKRKVELIIFRERVILLDV